MAAVEIDLDSGKNKETLKLPLEIRLPKAVTIKNIVVEFGTNDKRNSDLLIRIPNGCGYCRHTAIIKGDTLYLGAYNSP